MSVKKENSFYNALKRVRNFWTMNPRTRIKDNELKNKKKCRQEGRKETRGHDEFG